MYLVVAQVVSAVVVVYSMEYIWSINDHLGGIFCWSVRSVGVTDSWSFLNLMCCYVSLICGLVNEIVLDVEIFLCDCVRVY